MLYFTLIARQTDALALAADTETSPTDSNLERNKVTAKNILRRVASTSQQKPGQYPVQFSVESSSYNYHILTENGVMFLTMCDTSAPSAHAFAYLDDVAKEFMHQYSTQIENVTRPYPFIKFDLYLQKTKKVFSSSYARGVKTPANPNRPPPVKMQYKDVMGITDPNQSKQRSDSGLNSDEMSVVMIGAGVAVAVVVVVILVIYLLA
eukprot:Tbor_TRINITY_DN3032_c0_g1::TRINITY_DN3032_c0_g1_i1::g.17433::m.17433/K08517/SEC22; vesicle transport protein SEC22